MGRLDIRQYAGLGLFLLVAPAVFLVPEVRGSGAATVTARGLIGSEKSGLLDDPDVRTILERRHGVTVDYRRTGSLRLVRSDATGQDFLWPGSQYAREVFEQSHGGAPTRAEVILNSPLVLYTWRDVTRALQSQGLVEQVGEAWYLDLPRLVAVLNEGKSWRELGLPQLSGRAAVHTTDPTKSNSGMLFAALLANILSGSDVADTTTVQPALPQLKRYFDRLGRMEDSSGILFSQFLVMGIGTYPLIAGYENQLVEYALAHPQQRDLLKQQIDILYPRQTIWAAHSLIALTPAGERLMRGLLDPEVQRMAWERHGFRAGDPAVLNDPSVLQVIGVPRTFVQAGVPMPRADVMDRILETIQGR